MNSRIKKKKYKQKEKLFYKKYPFLKYNNTITNINIPIGWNKCFLTILLETLKEELIKQNLLNTYKIIELKEENGELLYRDNIEDNFEIKKIFLKFNYISKHVCYECGELDVYTININNKNMPLCKTCYNTKKLQKPYPTYDNKTHMKIKLHLFFEYNYIENGKEKFQILHIKDILQKIEK